MSTINTNTALKIYNNMRTRWITKYGPEAEEIAVKPDFFTSLVVEYTESTSTPTELGFAKYMLKDQLVLSTICRMDEEVLEENQDIEDKLNDVLEEYYGALIEKELDNEE